MYPAAPRLSGGEKRRPGKTGLSPTTYQYGQASLSRLLTSAGEADTRPHMDRVYTRLDRLMDRLVEKEKVLKKMPPLGR